jgi:hypothetical protein
MNKTLLAALNDAERQLVAETERPALDRLDEDDTLALHVRVRSARNKYVGQYRRTASARVAELGARGVAAPKNRRAALKAEAFEEALARVSRRLSTLANRSAAELRRDRLAAARAERGSGPASAAADAPTASGLPPAPRRRPSVASRNQLADSRAQGSRRQAKADRRR